MHRPSFLLTENLERFFLLLAPALALVMWAPSLGQKIIQSAHIPSNVAIILALTGIMLALLASFALAIAALYQLFEPLAKLENRLKSTKLSWMASPCILAVFSVATFLYWINVLAQFL